MEKLKTGQRIRFRSISDLSGKELELSGIILGNAEAVRIFWPEEMAEAKGCYLVRREDNFGNTFHHAVFPEEVL